MWRWTQNVSLADQRRARYWAKHYQLDAIFTTDGDGDRPLVADETGQWLAGDSLGMLCAQYLGATGLAVPVNANSAVETYLRIPVIRTKIGSPYVIAAMHQAAATSNYVAGFECNGGFLCASSMILAGSQIDALPTRDAWLPFICLLNMANESRLTLSQLIATLPKRFCASDRLKEFPRYKAQAYLTHWRNDIESLQTLIDRSTKITDMNNTDGLRVTYQDGLILHLRASGNAPELRCYCEADCPETARQYVIKVLEKVSTLPDISNN
ncbi:hypothetical protein [Marinomonas ostreistagni]|uniref:hypothetical protein n=1 Tax=Marinomonas ostreistagni TaxID=359209 RepID=UPI00195003B1|nr:hypothetical protein [Marinomonas ostreistagni]MBM6550220.1 hypothetical protein [Marinomonas ostreistagni]